MYGWCDKGTARREVNSSAENTVFCTGYRITIHKGGTYQSQNACWHIFSSPTDLYINRLNTMYTLRYIAPRSSVPLFQTVPFSQTMLNPLNCFPGTLYPSTSQFTPQYTSFIAKEQQFGLLPIMHFEINTFRRQYGRLLVSTSF